MRRFALVSFTLCALRLFSSPAHAQDAPAVQPPPPPASAPAPPAVALPPGSAPQVDPRLWAWQYEMIRIELELERLRGVRSRLFWPITLVSVGGGMAVLHGAVGLALWGMSRQRRYGWDERGDRYEYTAVDASDRSEARASAGIAVLGLAIASGGLAMLVPRVRVRRERSAQMRALRARQQQLLRPMQYSLILDSQRAGISASVQF